MRNIDLIQNTILKEIYKATEPFKKAGYEPAFISINENGSTYLYGHQTKPYEILYIPPMENWSEYLGVYCETAFKNDSITLGTNKLVYLSLTQNSAEIINMRMFELVVRKALFRVERFTANGLPVPANCYELLGSEVYGDGGLRFAFGASLNEFTGNPTHKVWKDKGMIIDLPKTAIYPLITKSADFRAALFAACEPIFKRAEELDYDRNRSALVGLWNETGGKFYDETEVMYAARFIYDIAMTISYLGNDICSLDEIKSRTRYNVVQCSTAITSGRHSVDYVIYKEFLKPYCRATKTAIPGEPPVLGYIEEQYLKDTLPLRTQNPTRFLKQ